MNKPWYLVGLALALQLAVVLILVPGDFTGTAIEKEGRMIESSLGKETRDWVFGKSNDWFQMTVIQSGLKEGMYKTLIPTEEAKTKSKGLETFGNRWFDLAADRIESLMLLIQQFYMRMALLLIWAPYMLVLFIPAIYDGIQTWKIKRSNFDYASPVIHRYSARLIGYSFGAMLLMFFLPFPIPPTVTPVVLMVICVAFGLVFGNYQKRI